MADQPATTPLDSIVGDTPDAPDQKTETPAEDPGADEAEANAEASQGETGETKDAPPASQAGDGAADPSDGDNAGEAGAADEKAVPAHVISALRKDLQGQLSAKDAQIGRLEQQVAKLTATPRPDEYEDPDGARAWDEDQRKTELWEIRRSLSVDMMRGFKDDYDEMASVAYQEAQSNPALAQQILDAENPARVAYDEGKRLSQVREMGENPQEYVQQAVEKAVAAALEGVEATLKKLGNTAAVNAAPESLAEATSQQGDAPAWDGPKDLNNILAGRR